MDLANSEFVLFLKCAAANKLRYMCIGGQAVNYYGYHRATNDLDVWIAPTEKNQKAFIKTLLCMGFTEEETVDVAQQDFTAHFKCSLGYPPYTIDVMTIVHIDIYFDQAEKNVETCLINNEVEMKFIPYNILIEIKSRTTRFKDWDDIAKLRELKKDN